MLHEAFMGIIHLFLCWHLDSNFLVPLNCINFANALQPQNLIAFCIAFPVIIPRSELGFDNFVQNLAIIHCAVI